MVEGLGFRAYQSLQRIYDTASAHLMSVGGVLAKALREWVVGGGRVERSSAFRDGYHPELLRTFHGILCRTSFRWTTLVGCRNTEIVHLALKPSPLPKPYTRQPKQVASVVGS